MNEDILKYVATKQDLEEFGLVRDEFRQFRSEVLSRLDRILTIVERLDQDRPFTFEYVKRLEAEGKTSRKAIDHIKDILKIS